MTGDSNNISRALDTGVLELGVLVTGANGQLGCELRKFFKSGSWALSGASSHGLGHDSGHGLFHAFYTDIAELDICDIDAVRRFVTDNKIDVIINCAAYTAVDKAEDDMIFTHRVNGEAPGILAAVAAEVGALLIHISTDYVFSGKGPLPYKEDDTATPVSVYGRTKLAGEYSIAASGCRYIIIRTSWLYSTYGGNFVKTILRLASEKDTISVVFDQIGTPTNAADLASAIGTIVTQATAKDNQTTVKDSQEADKTDNKTDNSNKNINNSNNNNKNRNIINTIYHFSNEGVCSWYDFAEEIVGYSGLKCKVIPVTSERFPTKAHRPAFSVLNKTKIKSAFGIEIPHWRSSLHNCLKTLKMEGLKMEGLK